MLSAFYFALRLAFPAGMGLGDVKWAGLVGLYIGWVRWEAASTATLVAFAGAALFIVVRRVATSEHVEHDTLPMAPFIAAGALVSILATWCLGETPMLSRKDSRNGYAFPDCGCRARSPIGVGRTADESSRLMTLGLRG